MDPLSHFHHSEYLVWAKTFRTELDSAIAALRKCISDNQKAGIVTPSDLCELEHKLGQRFQLLEMTEDALERVALNRTALSLATDKDGPNKTAIMVRLAEALLDRFSVANPEEAAVAWLDEAIELGRKALLLLQDHDTDVPVAICVVGSALRLRYIRLHNPDDLEEAIALHTLATDDRYSSHPQFYWFTAQLGYSCSQEHRKKDKVAATKHSERLQLQAMELCPNQDSRRHKVCWEYACSLHYLTQATRSAPLAHKVLHLFQELAHFYRGIGQIGQLLTRTLVYIQITYRLLGDLEDDPHFWFMAIECAQEVQNQAEDDERIR